VSAITSPAAIGSRASAPAVRRAAGLVGFALLLAATLFFSITMGARSITLDTIADAIWSFDPSVTEHVIVRDLRFPRTVLGMLVGAALGLAGTLMQGVTRNPLADPGILGVNAGAALFVVFGISVLGMTALTQYVWLAFLGAATASVLVYLVAAAGRDGATPIKLALSGAAITAAFASVTTVMLLLDVRTLNEFRFWEVGSLAGRQLDIVLQVLPFLLVGIALALLGGRTLNGLALGDHVARGLGQRVGLSRIVMALAIVVLCGAATAAAGPIVFAGLVIPHLARAIVGPDYRWILAYSLVLGPILLLGADVVGRVVSAPGEVQVGIVTAALGAPVFIALVRRRKLATL
jgi:iron complex transport system permease protein